MWFKTLFIISLLSLLLLYAKANIIQVECDGIIKVIRIDPILSAGAAAQVICNDCEEYVRNGFMNRCLGTIINGIAQFRKNATKVIDSNDGNNDNENNSKYDEGRDGKRIDELINVTCSMRHSHFAQELQFHNHAQIRTTSSQEEINPAITNNLMLSPIDGLPSVSLPAMPQHSRHRGAIVILTQLKNQKQIKNFLINLDLIYENYNHRFQEDIWIFHEGDLNVTWQDYIRGNRREIRFYQVTLEDGDIQPLVREGAWKQVYGTWSLGYRRMCRFFAIELWPLMHRMGYTWVMRLDDDSSILSPIEYNVFSFMEEYQYQYAYRTSARVEPTLSDKIRDVFWDFVQAYVIENEISDLNQLLDSCKRKDGISDFTYENCGHMPGYYNNFFVTNISWWMQDNVQKFLQHIDRLNVFYWYGMGDLTVQSLVVRLMLDEAHLHRFTSFTYAHTGLTYYSGILQTGLMDENPMEAIENFIELFKDNTTDMQYHKYLHVVSGGIFTLSSMLCDQHNIETRCFC